MQNLILTLLKLSLYFKEGVLSYLQLSSDTMQSCIDDAFMQSFDILLAINPEAASIF